MEVAFLSEQEANRSPTSLLLPPGDSSMRCPDVCIVGLKMYPL